MSDEYAIFDNGSRICKEMEDFFIKNSIDYTVIYKDRDSTPRIFPPNNQPAYFPRNFRNLKSTILEEITNQN